MSTTPASQHNVEIAANARAWEKKPLLRTIYTEFYREIANALGTADGEDVLELGSGIGAIKTVLPKCLTSDIFPNPWLDRQENAYSLNFPDASLSGIVLFDVWHHLRFPGTALREFARVLKPGGKVVIFDPAMGLLGRFVYGLFHHEPLGFGKPITWEPQQGCKPVLDYYAAQANCWRIFAMKSEPVPNSSPLALVCVTLMSALTYIASGGFSKPQLCPFRLYGRLKAIERSADRYPALFASRMLVVLEK